MLFVSVHLNNMQKERKKKQKKKSSDSFFSSLLSVLLLVFLLFLFCCVIKASVVAETYAMRKNELNRIAGKDYQFPSISLVFFFFCFVCIRFQGRIFSLMWNSLGHSGCSLSDWAMWRTHGKRKNKVRKCLTRNFVTGQELTTDFRYIDKFDARDLSIHDSFVVVS